MELTNKKTICLNMIVKDEEHIIIKTLDNLFKYLYFDYWVICDTGSSDNTKQVIINYFNDKNISGELIEHTWKNFGHNRTLALEAAFDKSDYLFIFDADDSINGDFLLPLPLLFDEYDFQFGKSFTYQRPLLINNRIKWKWIGVLHEYLNSISSVNTTIIKGDYYIESGRFGARSKDKDKYLKDAKILEKAYNEETNKDLADRYAFYCAQSYKDSNLIDESIKWYEKVLNLDNWNQEKYYSSYQLGHLYKSRKEDIKSVNSFLNTIKYDKERIEGLVDAAEYYYSNDQFLIVNMLYDKYKDYNKNPQNKLFLFQDKYNDNLEFYNSIASYYTNEKKVGYECCKKILINNILDDNRIKLTFNNLQFYISEIESDLDTFELFKSYNIIYNSKALEDSIGDNYVKIWNLLFEKNRNLITKYLLYNFNNKPNPKIIITFITCKRLNLFQQTINSILNNWEDKDKIDYWYCVDENSSVEDRNKMTKDYPFIEYYFKDHKQKSHRNSMNIIWNKLNELKPKYWIHMEDDFLFYHPMKYVSHSIFALENMKNMNIKQVLFNRNYGQTIEDYNIKGHNISINMDYVVHNYNTLSNFPYINCHYWPNYSFRPSIIDVETILSIGNYDSDNSFFEMDYANKYTKLGYKSAFFNLITNIHIGRSISKKYSDDIPNAYELNNETSVDCILINLDRREDRLEYYKTCLKIQFERYSAIDGNKLFYYDKMFNLLKYIDKKHITLDEIGCKLSHYDIWKNIKKDTLILEDNIIIHDNSLKELKDVSDNLNKIDDEWDIIYVSGQWTPSYNFNSETYIESHKLLESHIETVFKHINNGFYKRNFIIQDNDLFNTPLYRTTAGYIISNKGANKLCSIIDNDPEKFMIEPLDMWLLELEKNKLCSVIDRFPHPIYQGGFNLIKEKCLLETDINRSNKELFKFETDNILDKFIFIPKKDEIGSDLYYKKNNIENNLIECLNNPNACAVNTLGFFKNNINNLEKSIYFNDEDGIYIKKEFYINYFNDKPDKCVKVVDKLFKII
jgi:GR25 family glycosyltransferase involved in LPS biosynthesis